MQYIRKIRMVGGSQGILLPIDLCKYLEIENGDKVVIQDDAGKKGKFISMWKVTE